MIDFLKKQLFTVHQNGKHQVSEVFKFIGPGIIVTVGFIDPGNWAANLAAGASYGYELLFRHCTGANAYPNVPMNSCLAMYLDLC